MRPVTAALFGNLEYASELGKRSSESDVALHGYKEGDSQVSVIVPVRFPEKLPPVVYAANAARAALLVVPGLTKEVGESILAIDAAGVTRGIIVLQSYLQPEQIRPLLRGTTLADFAIVPDSAPTVRSELARLVAPPDETPGRVAIDHHFNVKGVGPVVLGFVEGAGVRQHDTLRVYPTKKTAQVRSIQVQDADVKEAVTGDHVGLALKGVETEDLDRGFVLAPDGALEVHEEKRNVKLEVAVSGFYKQGIDLGKVYTLIVGWQTTPVKIKAGLATPGSSGVFEAEPQKAIARATGQGGVLVDADAKGNRIVGRARFP
ncbi:MAG: EF-Tu/IF-2/RF-3 family GTPase [Methanobacteriota archaeon]